MTTPPQNYCAAVLLKSWMKVCPVVGPSRAPSFHTLWRRPFSTEKGCRARAFSGPGRRLAESRRVRRGVFCVCQNTGDGNLPLKRRRRTRRTRGRPPVSGANRYIIPCVLAFQMFTCKRCLMLSYSWRIVRQNPVRGQRDSEAFLSVTSSAEKGTETKEHCCAFGLRIIKRSRSFCADRPPEPVDHYPGFPADHSPNPTPRIANRAQA